jgi:hypothetical protein
MDDHGIVGWVIANLKEVLDSPGAFEWNLGPGPQVGADEKIFNPKVLAYFFLGYR